MPINILQKKHIAVPNTRSGGIAMVQQMRTLVSKWLAQGPTALSNPSQFYEALDAISVCYLEISHGFLRHYNALITTSPFEVVQQNDSDIQDLKSLSSALKKFSKLMADQTIWSWRPNLSELQIPGIVHLETTCLFRAGYWNLCRGKWKEAEKTFFEMLKEWPKSDYIEGRSARFYLGLCQLKLNDPKAETTLFEYFRSGNTRFRKSDLPNPPFPEFVCLEHRMIYRYEMARLRPRSRGYLETMADLLMYFGPDSHTSPFIQLRSNRKVLAEQMERHLVTPNDPLFEHAMVAFGLWMRKTDTGKLALTPPNGQPPRLFSCGHLVLQSERLDVAPGCGSRTPKFACPCCQKSGSEASQKRMDVYSKWFEKLVTLDPDSKMLAKCIVILGGKYFPSKDFETVAAAILNVIAEYRKNKTLDGCRGLDTEVRSAFNVVVDKALQRRHWPTIEKALTDPGWPPEYSWQVLSVLRGLDGDKLCGLQTIAKLVGKLFQNIRENSSQVTVSQVEIVQEVAERWPTSGLHSTLNDWVLQVFPTDATVLVKSNQITLAKEVLKAHLKVLSQFPDSLGEALRENPRLVDDLVYEFLEIRFGQGRTFLGHLENILGEKGKDVWVWAILKASAKLYSRGALDRILDLILEDFLRKNLTVVEPILLRTWRSENLGDLAQIILSRFRRWEALNKVVEEMKNIILGATTEILSNPNFNDSGWKALLARLRQTVGFYRDFNTLAEACVKLGFLESLLIEFMEVGDRSRVTEIFRTCLEKMESYSDALINKFNEHPWAVSDVVTEWVRDSKFEKLDKLTGCLGKGGQQMFVIAALRACDEIGREELSTKVATRYFPNAGVDEMVIAAANSRQVGLSISMRAAQWLLSYRNSWSKMEELIGDRLLTEYARRQLLKNPNFENPNWLRLFRKEEKESGFMQEAIPILVESLMQSGKLGDLTQYVTTNRSTLSVELLSAYCEVAPAHPSQWAFILIDTGHADLVIEMAKHLQLDIRLFEGCCNALLAFEKSGHDSDRYVMSIGQIFRFGLLRLFGARSLVADLQETTSLFVQVEETMVRAINAANANGQIRQRLSGWLEDIQSIRYRHSFSFANVDAVFPNIDQDQLALIVGSSILSKTSSIGAQTPIPYILLFLEFIRFFQTHLEVPKHPLADFKLSLNELGEFSKTLEDLQSSIDEFQKAKNNWISACLTRSSEADLVPIVMPEHHESHLRLIDGFRGLTLADQDMRALVHQIQKGEPLPGWSLEKMQTMPATNRLLRTNDSIQREEEKWIKAQWQKLHSAPDAHIILPSGFWSTEDVFQHVGNWSFTEIKRQDHQLTVTHINAGQGADYHSVSVDQTRSTGPDGVVVEAKWKASPFLKKISDISELGNAPPSWFYYLMRPGLLLLNSDGKMFKASQFYEVVWPMVPGTLVVPKKANEMVMKTPFRSAISPFGVVKNFLLWRASSKSAYKRFIAAFDLWVGTAVLRRLMSEDAETLNVAYSRMAIEFCHKLSSDAIKHLKDASESHTVFLVGQTQELALALSSAAKSQMAGKEKTHPFGIPNRFSARFRLPLERPTTQKAETKVALVPTQFAPPSFLKDSWVGFFEFSKEMEDYLAILSQLPNEIRIARVSMAIQSWVLAANSVGKILEASDLSPENIHLLATVAQKFARLCFVTNHQRQALLGQRQLPPVDYSNMVLTCLVCTGITIMCLRAHPETGPISENGYFPIGGIRKTSGVIPDLDRLLASLTIPNSDWQKVATMCRKFFESDKQPSHRARPRDPLFDEWGTMMQVNSSGTTGQPKFLEIIESLWESLPSAIRDEWLGLDPKLNESQYRKTKLFHKNPFPVVSAVIVSLQMTHMAIEFVRPRVKDPSSVPDGIDISFGVSFYSGGHVAYVYASYWWDVEAHSIPSFVEEMDPSLRQIVGFSGQSENKILAESANGPELMPVGHFHQVALTGSNVIFQRIERIYTHIKDGVLDIEDPSTQKLILQWLWGTTVEQEDSKQTAFQEANTKQHALITAFRPLVETQFKRLIHKATATSLGIEFLIHMGVILRQWSDEPRDWTLLIHTMRMEWAKLGMRQDTVANKMEGVVATSVLRTFKYQTSLFSNKEMATLLTMISRIKKHRNLGRPITMVGQAPATLNSPESLGATFEIRQIAAQFHADVHAHLMSDSGSASKILVNVARVRNISTDDPWVYDSDTHHWTSGIYAVDLFSGDFFANGFPLGTLPESVVNHPHYREYFGEALFEVFRDSQTGIYHTADRRYRFTQTPLPKNQNTAVRLTSTNAEYRGRTFRKIDSNWYQHASALSSIIGILLGAFCKSVPSLKTFKLESQYLLVSEEFAFLANMNDKQAVTKVVQIRHDYADGVEVCIFSKSVDEFVGRLGRGRGAPYTRQVSNIPEARLLIEADFQDSTGFHQAVPRWVIETQIPGFVCERVDGKLFQYWVHNGEIHCFEPSENRVEYILRNAEQDRWVILHSERPNRRIANVFETLDPKLVSLYRLENPNLVVVEGQVSDNETIEPDCIRFPRFGLTLEKTLLPGAGAESLWQFQEIPGVVSAPIQNLPIWPGFSRYFVLISPEHVQLTDYSGIEFQILVPHVDFEQAPNQEQILGPSVNTGYLGVHTGGYEVLTYDPLLRRLKAHSILGKLIQGFLFMATASLVKSKYTGLNGYEMAAEILNECVQNKPFSEDETRLIMAILNTHDTHRNAHAIRLITAYLYFESMSFPSFYPQASKLMIDRLDGEYHAYLMKAGRVSQKCRLTLSQLKLLENAFQENLRQTSEMDTHIFSLIQATEFGSEVGKIAGVENAVKIGKDYWSWAEIKGEISTVFLSVMGHIKDQTISVEDVRYLIRFLAIGKSVGNDYSHKTNRTLLKLLWVVNENRDRLDLSRFSRCFDQVRTFEFKKCFVEAKRLIELIPLNWAFNEKDRATLVGDALEKMARQWSGPLGSGVVVQETFESHLDELVSKSKAILISISKPKELRETLRALFQEWRDQFECVELMSYLSQLADDCRRECVSIKVQESARFRSDTVVKANRSGIGFAELDFERDRRKFVEVLQDLVYKNTPPAEESHLVSTFQEGIDQLRKLIDQAHPAKFVRREFQELAYSEFPLESYRPASGASPFLHGRFRRLEQSWTTHLKIPKAQMDIWVSDDIEPKEQISVLRDWMRNQLKDWTDAAAKITAWLMEVVDRIPDNPTGWKMLIERMQRDTSLTARDFLQVLHDPDAMIRHNPFLGVVLTEITAAVALFGQLESRCQHLRRCIELANVAIGIQTKPVPDKKELHLVTVQLCRQLIEKGILGVSTSPQLVNTHAHFMRFELDNNLLIRDKQLAMADMIVGADKILGSMNMGEGKSSVVMMLILIEIVRQTRSKSNGKSICRIIVPAPLMADMERLIRTRIGPSFNISVFVFPFSRRAMSKISLEELDILSRQVQFCKDHGHVILMTPEHVAGLRLSIEEAKLRLVRSDITNGADRKRLEKIDLVLSNLVRAIGLDIIDEADSVLSLQTETNYTLGNALPIDGSPIRQQVGLSAVRFLLFDPELKQESGDGVLRKCVEGREQLLFESPAAFSEPLRRRLAEKLIRRYFAQSTPQMADYVLSEKGTQIPTALDRDNVSMLRSIRAWCSRDLVGYIFGQRHRVDYGLFDETGFSPDEILMNRHHAVPYRNKDLPVVTSSFEHPEVRIGFTVLSYFYSGLRMDQVKAALKYLSSAHYSRGPQFASWMQSAPSSIVIREWETLDVENPDHIRQIYPHLSCHPEIVEYFLINVVFAKNLDFPEKISSNAATMVTTLPGVRVNGFSGTQTQALPPGISTDISQHIRGEVVNELLATEALSLEIFRNPLVVCVESDPIPRTTDDFLKKVIQRLCDPQKPELSAVLDPGALITGLTNAQTARRLLELILQPGIPDFVQQRIKGIVYFEDQTDVVMVAKGELNDIRCVPLATCSFGINHILTYFNDAKTRGTDRKLPLTSAGILTVGKDMTTEQLVQAAMRLRQLGQGQTVELWIDPDVETQVRRFEREKRGDSLENLTGLSVYAWTVYNTAQREEELSEGRDQKSQRAKEKLVVLEPVSRAVQYQGILVSKSGLPLASYDPRGPMPPDSVGAPARASAASGARAWISANYQSFGRLNPIPPPFKRGAASFGRVVQYLAETETWAELEQSDAKTELNQRAETQVQTEGQHKVLASVKLAAKEPQKEAEWNFKEVLNPAWFNKVLAQSQLPGFQGEFKIVSMSGWFDLKALPAGHFLTTVHLSQNFLLVASDSTMNKPISDRLRPVEAYLEVKDSKTNRVHAILVSGKEAQHLKAVLLSDEARAANVHVVLRQLSDPSGPTLVSAGSLSLENVPLYHAQQMILILANLVNGESGLNISDPQQVLKRDNLQDLATELLEEMIHGLSDAQTKILFERLQQIRECRGKTTRFPQSPLHKVATSLVLASAVPRK